MVEGYVIKSMFGTRFWPAIDSRYISAAQALSMQDQKAYLTSLTVARARASSQSDFMGVVSIPLFIGLLSIYVMLDLSRELIVFYFGILIVFMFSYYYYRIQKALIAALLEVAQENLRG